MKRSLWLARHAIALVDPGVCYGSTDLAADATATQEAAERIAAIVPREIQVRTSPLRRCVALAQALQLLRPDLEATPDPRLREMDFGAWEGHLWQDIPRSHFDDWTRNFAGHRFGGRESVDELMARVTSAWRESLADEVDTLWITHAGVIRAACLIDQGVMNGASADQWPREIFGFGQLHRLEKRP